MNEETDNSTINYKTFFLKAEWHSKVIGLLVGVLMITIYIWVAAGILSLGSHLIESSISSWSRGAEEMIKEVVIILASLELIRTLQSYLRLGRVKVTFILDAALVVLIGELISLWFRDYSITGVMVNIGVISTLTILRIITTKFSPDSLESTA